MRIKIKDFKSAPWWTLKQCAVKWNSNQCHYFIKYFKIETISPRWRTTYIFSFYIENAYISKLARVASTSQFVFETWFARAHIAYSSSYLYQYFIKIIIRICVNITSLMMMMAYAIRTRIARHNENE